MPKSRPSPMAPAPTDASPPRALPPRALLVVGMHRSGTSAVTRVLNLLGARLSEKLMPAAPDNNEKGFWESAEVVALHEDLLAAVSRHWDDYAGIPPEWLASPAAREFRWRLVQILQRDFGDAPLFAVKDPRLGRVIPLWRDALSDIAVRPGFIIPVRNPLEVAASLSKRDGMLPGGAAMLWLRHMLDAERDSRGHARSFVGYDELMGDWRAAVARIARDLGIAWPTAPEDAAGAIEDFLSPQLRHTRFDAAAVARHPDLPACVKRGYAAALKLQHGDEAAAQAELDALHAELEAAEGMLAPVLAEESRRMAGQRDRIQGLQAEATGLRTVIHEKNLELIRQTQEMDRLHQSMAALQQERGHLHQQVGRLGGDIDHLNAAIAGLNGQITGLHASLADRDRHIADRDHRIADLLAHLTEARRQTELIYQSTSWKVSAPLRAARRLVGRLRALRTAGRSRTLSLVPASQLEAHGPPHEGRLRSVGADPFFWLQSPTGDLPRGWVTVSFRGNRADGGELTPQIHVDAGNGYDSPPLVVPSWAQHRPLLCRLPDRVAGLRFDPVEGEGVVFRLESVDIREVSPAWVMARRLAGLGLRALRDPRHAVRQAREAASVVRTRGWRGLADRLTPPVQAGLGYEEWVRCFDTLTDEDRAAIRRDIAGLAHPPVISVVVPVYNVEERWLRRAIESVTGQLYPHWELCLADDASPAPHVRRVLEEYQRRDPRIKVVFRAANGHISAASNSALELAGGDYVALLDHDDELPEHALYCVAREIADHPDADILFSDEDKIDEAGRRHAPYFKSSWNPDLMRSQNAVTHLGVYRRSLLTEIGGFRLGFEGSQDYDLVLRASEHTTAERIRHIPRVLYHWRTIAGSTAVAVSEKNYAWEAGRRALAEHLERQGITGAEVLPAGRIGEYYRVRYPLPDPLPPVSLIVPTRDRVELLRGCVEGLLHETDYPALEVVIVDNGSVEAGTLAYFAEVAKDPRVRILPFDGPFNYSAINNAAAREAKGEILGLVNNDIKVIEPGWLKEMVAHAVRPEVGAVGTMLYYGDDSVQHAGIIMGIGGVAGHIHRFLPRGETGYFGRAALTQTLSAVTAACLLVRRERFEAVGGLDEANLKVAFNDVDFCLRLTEKGWRNVWTPFAPLYHLESASRGSDQRPERLAAFQGEIRHMQERWSDLLAAGDPYFNPNLSLKSEQPMLAFPPQQAKPWRGK